MDKIITTNNVISTGITISDILNPLSQQNGAIQKGALIRLARPIIEDRFYSYKGLNIKNLFYLCRHLLRVCFLLNLNGILGLC